jgi:Mg2+/Co2+ transporter CorB
MQVMISALSITLVAIILLLVLSGFFSGSETALTAVSGARMHHLANEGSRRAKSVNALIENRERLIGALLLGNTFVNILASALATEVALAYLPTGGVAVVTFTLTAAILIFAEVLPKTFAIARTDRMALAVAPSVRILVAVLGPIVNTVQYVVWRVLALFGMHQEQEAEETVTAHEEIRGAIDLHHKEGGVEREHRDMLGGVLNLMELKISDVMVHRKNMIVLDAADPLEEIVERVLSSPHTRFPISRDDPENIVGVLHVKDLLQVLIRSRGSLEGIDLLGLTVQPWFVPETTTLEEQLQAFRDRHAHFSLVVDEYGTLQGLITLEDILEEVFGDLADVHDQKAATGIRRQADGSYNVDGWMPVRDLNRELNWSLPDEEATTIAGLVINAARTIPTVGQVFSFYGFKFEILRRQRNQITALRITPPRQALAS